MPPSRVSKFEAYASVRQAARLRQCCGRICEEIFGRPVTDLVLSHPEIRLAECGAVEGMQYGRRNIEAADRLALVLGPTGTNVILKLTSFLLVCIGVQIFWNGVSQLIRTLLQ